MKRCNNSAKIGLNNYENKITTQIVAIHCGEAKNNDKSSANKYGHICAIALHIN